MRISVLFKRAFITFAAVACLSTMTGAAGAAALWTQPGKAAYWSSPTISQGTIYVTSRNGKLLTFAPSGAGQRPKE
jgi:outer membrane protein assembly factor BamB